MRTKQVGVVTGASVVWLGTGVVAYWCQPAQDWAWAWALTVGGSLALAIAFQLLRRRGWHIPWPSALVAILAPGLVSLGVLQGRFPWEQRLTAESVARGGVLTSLASVALLLAAGVAASLWVAVTVAALVWVGPSPLTQPKGARSSHRAAGVALVLALPLVLLLMLLMRAGRVLSETSGATRFAAFSQILALVEPLFALAVGGAGVVLVGLVGVGWLSLRDTHPSGRRWGVLETLMDAALLVGVALAYRATLYRVGRWIGSDRHTVGQWDQGFLRAQPEGRRDPF